MLNLTEGVVDVFDGTGYFDLEEELSEQSSSELLQFLQDCMGHDPLDRPTLPEILQEIHRHRLTLQADLRDKPGNSGDWDDHLLLETATNMVRVRTYMAQNFEHILTTF